jgi:hypothetical protein
MSPLIFINTMLSQVAAYLNILWRNRLGSNSLLVYMPVFFDTLQVYSRITIYFPDQTYFWNSIRTVEWRMRDVWKVMLKNLEPKGNMLASASSFASEY